MSMLLCMVCDFISLSMRNVLSSVIDKFWLMFLLVCMVSVSVMISVVMFVSFSIYLFGNGVFCIYSSVC